MNKDVKSVFTPAPMISFRCARKLSSYLARAKLYPLERTVGSVQCKGKRFQTCHNVKEVETFANTTMGKTFKINHKLNCNDKCLVYLLICNVCLKQYVGHTVADADGTIARTTAVIIKSVAHVCSNTFLIIFLRRDAIVFWKMFLLH